MQQCKRIVWSPFPLHISPPIALYVQPPVRLRLHTCRYALMLAIVALHIAFFVVVIVFIDAQTSSITEVNAAGERSTTGPMHSAPLSARAAPWQWAQGT